MSQTAARLVDHVVLLLPVPQVLQRVLRHYFLPAMALMSFIKRSG